MVSVRTEIKIPEMKIPVELEIPAIPAAVTEISKTEEKSPTAFIKPLEIKPFGGVSTAPSITTGDTFEKLEKLASALKPLAEKGLELTKKVIEKLKERKPVTEKEIEETVGKEKKEDVKKIFKELGIPVISTEEQLTEKEKIALSLGIPVYSSSEEVTREKAAKAL